MSGPGVGLLVTLLKAVARLAWPAEAQLGELRKRGLLPSTDELALDLHDLVALVPQFVSSGWLSQADASAITELDQLLGRMSGPEHSDLWTERALQESSEWKEVRRQARAVLGG